LHLTIVKTPEPHQDEPHKICRHQGKHVAFSLKCKIKDFLNKIYSKTRYRLPKFQKLGIAIPMRTLKD